ncbi:hypothetical protein L345_05716, partial [Ophiophagus hannah]
MFDTQTFKFPVGSVGAKIETAKRKEKDEHVCRPWDKQKPSVYMAVSLQVVQAVLDKNSNLVFGSLKLFPTHTHKHKVEDKFDKAVRLEDIAYAYKQSSEFSHTTEDKSKMKESERTCMVKVVQEETKRQSEKGQGETSEGSSQRIKELIQHAEKSRSSPKAIPQSKECFICREGDEMGRDGLLHFCDCKNLFAHQKCLLTWIQKSLHNENVPTCKVCTAEGCAKLSALLAFGKIYGLTSAELVVTSKATKAVVMVGKQWLSGLQTIFRTLDSILKDITFKDWPCTQLITGVQRKIIIYDRIQRYQLEKKSPWRLLATQWHQWVIFCTVLGLMISTPFLVYQMIIAFKDPPPGLLFNIAAICFGALTEMLLTKGTDGSRLLQQNYQRFLWQLYDEQICYCLNFHRSKMQYIEPYHDAVQQPTLCVIQLLPASSFMQVFETRRDSVQLLKSASGDLTKKLRQGSSSASAKSLIKVQGWPKKVKHNRQIKQPHADQQHIYTRKHTFNSEQKKKWVRLYGRCSKEKTTSSQFPALQTQFVVHAHNSTDMA